MRPQLARLAQPRYKAWMEKYGQGMKEMREEYDSKLKDSIYYSAPAVVFVIGLGMTSDQDCPMACENIMLAARSLELGSCWVYFGQLVLDDPQTRALLELKEGEKVYGPIVLGYPKEGFPPSPPKKEPVIKWI
ncbi:MAG: nitroreductase family protein [Candidatus Margulisiibacteriota bacterium]|jgi:nitroreductase